MANVIFQRVASSTFELGLTLSRGVHSTPALLAGARYREKKGQERHVNRHRAFADTPDWSYLDGRPAPLSVGQRERHFQQMDHNRTIQMMLEQVDYAKAKEADRLAVAAQTKAQIIANKLRSKGKELFVKEIHRKNRAEKKEKL